MKQSNRNRSFLKVMGALLGIITLSASTFGSGAIRSHRLHRTMMVDGERRGYLVYIPAGYDPQKAVPLVISIHGYMGWPANQEQVSGWDDVADKNGFIVVYPKGTGMPLHWRASGTSDSYKDVDFISALIDQLEKEYNIDPARIYVNGHSNGGGMTFMLTCTLCDRIAAAGGVAGAYLYPWSSCQTTRAVPFIAFHGDADPVVPYTGGPSREFDLPFPDISTWVGQYAVHAGCITAAVTSQPADGVTRTQYEGCQQGADVELYTIAGSGHGWMGHGADLPAFIVGPTKNTIDATEVMWQFFSDHTLKK